MSVYHEIFIIILLFLAVMCSLLIALILRTKKLETRINNLTYNSSKDSIEDSIENTKNLIEELGKKHNEVEKDITRLHKSIKRISHQQQKESD